MVDKPKRIFGGGRVGGGGGQGVEGREGGW